MRPRPKKKHAARLAALVLLLASAALLCACARSRQGDADNATQNAPAQASGSPGAAADDPAKLDADIERLEKAAERNPGDEDTRDDLARAYVRRGDAQRSAGKLQEALSDYQRALRLDPDNAEAQAGAAASREQLGGEQQGENGEPAPLPITPNVADEDQKPTPTPSPKKH